MATTSVPTEVPEIERRTMRAVGWRIVPFLVLCYFIAYVDRVNAGFAALTMNKDLGLSQAMFGIGGGLFFVAYVLCEVPSNLAMEKFGARVWIARIMITWGLVGAAMAFVVGPYSFYLGRFLLGAAEAGFFPGVILYLTYWFPKAYRARIVAMFMVAIPISSFLGSPLSAGLLQLDGAAGLHGWQWLFIAEAIPAVLLGLAALFVLPSRPAEAKWLAPEQRAWLEGRLEADKAGAAPVAHHLPLLKVLSNKYVWALALIYSGSSATSNALSLWQPQILKSFGLSNLETGLLNMIPFGIASVFMVFWGLRADKSGERVYSTALPLALTCLCLAATNLTNSLTLTMVLLSFTLLGNYAIKGPFWAMATEWLSAGTAAAGIAAINTLSHLGTGIASWLLGVIKDATGSFPMGLLPLVVLTGAGSIMTIILGRGSRAQASAPAPAPAE
ncbi:MULTISPECIES: MFS transporter [unclassified Methylobacterium]|uniref:MFS transporter n=1 Tax=unclassified Methylobacterium TaxID=2615210 RepID=UPI001FBB4EFC|nr:MULTISPECIES: MFS transporter [unclassified Methylobacterium]MCJ2016290.1 MFS transporter [Methylobacterium sp. E-065]